MNGTAFYEFLRSTYATEGQHILGDYTFVAWLTKRNHGASLRFKAGNGIIRSIPQEVLVAAWDANIQIRDSWLIAKDFPRFSNDWRLHFLNALIGMYAPLRDKQLEEG